MTSATAGIARGAYKSIPENTARNTHATVFSLLQEEPDAGRVLDTPSGAGAFTLRLLEAGKEAWAGDIERNLEPAAQAARFAPLDLNDRLPFDDGFFDAVVSIDGIEHLERPFDFVREVARVTRPGGTFLVSTPNITSLRSRWRFFWTGHHNKGKVPLNEAQASALHHIGLLTFAELRYMLHSCGFRIERVTTNRVKAVSWAYAIFAPIAWAVTARVFRKEEKDPAQRERNREILRQVHGRALLFGETMIVKARRVEAAPAAAAARGAGGHG